MQKQPENECDHEEAFWCQQKSEREKADDTRYHRRNEWAVTRLASRNATNSFELISNRSKRNFERQEPSSRYDELTETSRDESICRARLPRPRHRLLIQIFRPLE